MLVYSNSNSDKQNNQQTGDIMKSEAYFRNQVLVRVGHVSQVVINTHEGLPEAQVLTEQGRVFVVLGGTDKFIKAQIDVIAQLDQIMNNTSHHRRVIMSTQEHRDKYDPRVTQCHVDHLLNIAPSDVWHWMYQEDSHFNTGSYKNVVSWRLCKLSFWDNLPRLSTSKSLSENVSTWKAAARHIALKHLHIDD